jgi:hypothetical protein
MLSTKNKKKLGDSQRVAAGFKRVFLINYEPLWWLFDMVGHYKLEQLSWQ